MLTLSLIVFKDSSSLILMFIFCSFLCVFSYCFLFSGGWSGGAMDLGNLPVPGRPTIWVRVGQGPSALAVGAGGDCFDIFTLTYPFSSLGVVGWCDGAR